jgi:Bacterial regulatory proteins, luxR family
MKVYPYLLRIWRSSERITLGRRHYRFVDAPRLCLAGGPSWTGSARKMLAREVAELLELSEKTIHHHVEHILGKLQARNRTHAVVKGSQLGLFLLE